MDRYSIFILSVAGGILSGLAWTGWCPGLILLASFVPFLLIENHLYLNKPAYSANAFFIYILPGFLVFNTISLAWVRAANVPAAVAVIMEMSFVMSFIMWMFHMVRLKAGNIAGYAAFISFWMAFEYLSLHSVYLSPWVNLGNGLSKDILFIQWYEATGVSGGTLWILLSNLLLTLFLINHSGNGKNTVRFIIIWLAAIIVPSVISVTIYVSHPKDLSPGNEVVIIQPNIDPFTEKYTIPFAEQLNKAIMMAENCVTEKTTWVLFPETIVDDPVNEADIENNKYISALRSLAENHGGLNIVAGLVSYKLYPGETVAPTRTAKKTELSEYYADHFNSAFRIGPQSEPAIYHKSRLVPGIEMQFSALIGKIMEMILPDMGGTIWGYGTQDTRTCFRHSITGQAVAPVICYESVFGNFVADYVREGAEALFILTNDGWWKNTNGYLQHFSYASLRAIETRRPVARCANTGISCITDIRGKVSKEIPWWTRDCLRGEINPGKKTTFYVRYGDYISVAATIITLIILLSVFVIRPILKRIQGRKRIS